MSCSVAPLFHQTNPSAQSMRMFHFYVSNYLMLFAALWSLSYPGFLAAGSKQKDPNVRDWGDYSDLPPGIEHGLGLREDRENDYNRGVGESSSSPQLDFLAGFAGKKRLWVITAPSHNDHYLQMMEKQLEDAEQKALNCRLAERDTFIITIIQNAMMEGRIQKTTVQGDATVENLDPDTVTKLLHYLDLTNQDQTFSMLVMRKNLRVSERFPYPVRVEAILELIDQFPMRRLEKMTKKGSQFRCKSTKKKVVVKRKKTMKKVMLSPQRQGNVPYVVPPQRKSPLDKKAALKSKIQDILRGRSRFVIRKKLPSETKKDKESSNDWDTSKVPSRPSAARSSKEGEKARPHSTVEDKKKIRGGQKTEDKVEPNVQVDKQDKKSSKKKSKGKKGKKGKGRGRKSSRDASEEDKTSLKTFLDSLRGSRRLMLISTPSRDATLYSQLMEESKKKHCELAIRKITVATAVGEGSEATVLLQHYQLESDRPLSDQSEQTLDPGLIHLLRAEFGMSSPDLFSMTVTDYDMKPNRVFEAPPSSLALFEYIDHFPSRYSEKEKERKNPSVCAQPSFVENSLVRFTSKRRLLVISAPSEDDYSFQQQLSTLSGQECYLGIRHFVMLKLSGNGKKASGTVELFPLNGRSQSKVELLSRDMVNNVREQLKISEDYFSMLVVGKDGDVKAWFPSPMWSLDNIYDLVDSMELRLQEEKLQKRLGIHCPEDRGRGGSEAGHYPGYDEDGAEETYSYHQSQK